MATEAERRILHIISKDVNLINPTQMCIEEEYSGTETHVGFLGDTIGSKGTLGAISRYAKSLDSAYFTDIYSTLDSNHIVLSNIGSLTEPTTRKYHSHDTSISAHAIHRGTFGIDIGVGAGVMPNATTSATVYNVNIGCEAGYNTISKHSVNIGYRAGAYSNIEGARRAHNVAIGVNTGQITSAHSNCIYIGPRAGSIVAMDYYNNIPLTNDGDFLLGCYTDTLGDTGPLLGGNVGTGRLNIKKVLNLTPSHILSASDSYMGDIMYNSTSGTNAPQYFDGVAWKDFGGKGVAPSPGIDDRIYTSDGASDWQETTFTAKFDGVNRISASSGTVAIEAKYDIRMNIDSDNNSTNADFRVIKGINNAYETLFIVGQNGKVTAPYRNQIGATSMSEKELITKEYADSRYRRVEYHYETYASSSITPDYGDGDFQYHSGDNTTPITLHTPNGMVAGDSMVVVIRRNVGASIVAAFPNSSSWILLEAGEPYGRYILTITLSDTGEYFVTPASPVFRS